MYSLEGLGSGDLGGEQPASWEALSKTWILNRRTGPAVTFPLCISVPLSPPRPQVLTVEMLPSPWKGSEGGWSFQGPLVSPFSRLRLGGEVRMPPAPAEGTAQESCRLTSPPPPPPHPLPPVLAPDGLRHWA